MQTMAQRVANKMKQSIEEINNTWDLNMQQSSSSTDTDDISSSSGSFNVTQSGQPRNSPQIYKLSCGMTLPKRHRPQRQHVSSTQLPSIEHRMRSCDAVKYESPLSLSQSVGRKRKRKEKPASQRNFQDHCSSQERPPTPFQFLPPQLMPFQSCVTNINSSQFDAIKSEVIEPISCRPGQGELLKSQSLLAPFATSSTGDVSSKVYALPTGDTTYNCKILLSSRIRSITEALEFSDKPHCLIEALPPYRVLHTNAALYTLLLHANHSPTEPNVCCETVVPKSESSMSPSTSPFSTHKTQSSPGPQLLSTWDAIQIQINLLFGLCFASVATPTLTTNNPSIILYPVYATRSDLDMLLTQTESSANGISSAPPRYYLIEISVEQDSNVPPTVNVMKKGNEKSECISLSSMDEPPKLVVA